MQVLPLTVNIPPSIVREIGRLVVRDELMEFRDRLAHGVWPIDKKTGAIYLRITRGKWSQKSHLAGTSRRLKPQGIQITADQIAAKNRHFDRCIGIVSHLRLEIGEREKSLPRK